jgi:hypothetical protein
MIALTRLVLMTTVLAGSLATAEARSATGLYLTAEAYQSGRLTSESDCGSPGHKLELHDILHKSFIEVTHEGKSQRYEKSQVYGFRSCEGKDYRFVDNNEYRILEARDVSIYESAVPVENRKDTGDLNFPASRAFFFSVASGGAVLPLTRQNLKQAFPNNQAFHNALDATFHGDDELAQFDALHKMFTVNRLLAAPPIGK